MYDYAEPTSEDGVVRIVGCVCATFVNISPLYDCTGRNMPSLEKVGWNFKHFLAPNLNHAQTGPERVVVFAAAFKIRSKVGIQLVIK